MLRRRLSAWAQMPLSMRAGLVVIVLGTVADMAAHITARNSVGGFTLPQHAAHFVILVGMLVTLAGIVHSSPSARTKKRAHPRR